VSVANHLLVPNLVFEMGVGLDPGGGLGLDGLGVMNGAILSLK
jgi:hypothetical protein